MFTTMNDSTPLEHTPLLVPSSSCEINIDQDINSSPSSSSSSSSDDDNSNSRLISLTLFMLLSITFLFGIYAFPTSSTSNLRVASLQAAPCDVDKAGVSFCPGLLPGNIANVHLKPGCVMMSVNDLSELEHIPSYSSSPILTICASMSAGVVTVDHDILQKYKMATDKKSMVSSILFSDDSQIKLFEGKKFDGAVIGSNGTPYKDPYTKVLGLGNLKYPHTEAHVNDNVFSFLYATSSIEMNSCLSAMEFLKE